jgi:hypothetical protein
LHLTVGINVHRWADLLHEALLNLTRRDERFRASIPPGLLGGHQIPGPVRDRFKDLLGVIANDLDLDEAVQQIGDQFFGGLAVLPGSHFRNGTPAESLDEDTLLEKRPGMICRVVQEGAWVAIEFPGGRVEGPLKIAPALRFVAETEEFPISALPGVSGRESKLVLARRLLSEGLVRVAVAEAVAARAHPRAGSLAVGHEMMAAGGA